MENDNCENGEHVWVCKQTEGMLGELVKKIPLTSSEVESAKSNSDKRNEICPGGIIECEKCQKSLLGNKETKPEINFDDLIRRIE